ncbi:hypothetical protein IDH44_15195 [Paenibacillus sp. IB182496]|uniref:Uncharacterized protein n=1 Tax=Paenibacillus sabuli TaxID=2772509 RepID=A0A927BVK7_9BACL|nr:hypothetical protein [Paenibacillus sabuli]MBD2846545.1 hypothetical protein [Paenibacillus sabuli]
MAHGYRGNRLESKLPALELASIWPRPVLFIHGAVRTDRRAPWDSQAGGRVETLPPAWV